MAAPVLAAAGIAAASQAGQIYATGKTNKKTREWNEMMYGRTRQDALDDWNRQNLYNSPLAQMQRYKEAGLNPNLIYGQMDTAPAIRAGDSGSWNPQTPDVAGIADKGLEVYQDYTLQSEQIKNMQAQRSLMELEGALKTIEVSSKGRQDKMDEELYDVAVNTAHERLFQIINQAKFAQDEADRKRELHGPTLQAALNNAVRSSPDSRENLAKLKVLENRGVLDDLEIAMREKGMSYSDDLVYRLLVRVSDGQLSLADFIRGLWSNLRK